MSGQNSPNEIVDHLFRHEAGKMVAVLTRIFGIHNLEMAEDVVQEAFLKAAQTWRFDALPQNPAAWLMQVAKNKALDIVRRTQHFNQLSQEVSAQLQQEANNTIEQFFLDSEIADSQLRLIFACCHPALKEEDQIALTLKTISAFGITEIAKALLTNEATIQKRIYRAKQFIREQNIQLEIPVGTELLERLNTVYTVLYLLFNEGYNSAKADELIRKDLCAEAMRLCLLLSEHKTGDRPVTYALLSLMCFHAARFESRLNENNEMILLAQQDRTKWDKPLMERGYFFLNKSSSGKLLSIYHIESAIAAEHCMAATFEQTNFRRLLHLYDLLLQMKPTPVVQMNRAIALSYSGETESAVEYFLGIPGLENLLQSQYMFNAVLGELYARNNDAAKAEMFFQKALSLTNSSAEKKLLNEKISKVRSMQWS